MLPFLWYNARAYVQHVHCVSRKYRCKDVHTLAEDGSEWLYQGYLVNKDASMCITNLFYTIHELLLAVDCIPTHTTNVHADTSHKGLHTYSDQV